MTNKTAAEARLRLKLSTGIIANQHKIYSAVTCAAVDCLNHQLAMEILEIADWSPEDFKRAYLAGELGE